MDCIKVVLYCKNCDTVIGENFTSSRMESKNSRQAAFVVNRKAVESTNDIQNTNEIQNQLPSTLIKNADYVSPISEYIAVAQDKKEFIFLNLADLRKYAIFKNNYMCQRNIPVVRKLQCESELLTDPKHTSKTMVLFCTTDNGIGRVHGEKFVPNITRSALLFFDTALRTKFVAAPCDYGMELWEERMTCSVNRMEWLRVEYRGRVKRA